MVAGCSDPTEQTDLRPDGPPEVLAVLVLDDPAGVIETATFCKTTGPNDGPAGAGDPKRPSLVDLPEFAGTTQLCPDDPTKGVDPVTDAAPQSWYVRIVFDELLDPSIEKLVPIKDANGNDTGNFTGSLADSQPVTLSCGGMAVAYDGYYQPSGNAFTWPVGPSLVITPNDPTSVPTSASCTLQLKPRVVKDKQGNPVPADQLGPFTFSIAALAIVSTDPQPAAMPADRAVIDPAAPVTLTFDDLIDPTTIDATDVALFGGVRADCTGGTRLANAAVGVFQAQDAMMNVIDPTSIQIYDTSAPGVNPNPADPSSSGNLFAPNDTYRLELTATASASDVAGGTAPLALPSGATSVCFDTGAGM
jgi:hypothetical protein